MQTNPSEATIYRLAAAPAARRIFAARADGLFFSDDLGTRWLYAYRSFLQQPLPTLAVALSPSFDRDHTVIAGVPGGLLRSSDAGETWTVSRFEDPPPMFQAIAFSPAYERDGTVFGVSDDDGVFCSYDSGATWTNWNFGLLDANGLSIAVSPAFAEDRTVFAGTSTGLFRSSNGGKSWQAVRLPEDDLPVLSLAVLPGTLFAGTSGAGLFRSSDGGKSWMPTGGLAGRSVDALLAGAFGLIALVEDTVLRSTDGGAIFQPYPLAGALEQAAVSAVCVVPGKPARLAAALAGNQIVVAEGD